MMDQSRESLPEHRFDLQELLRELADLESLVTVGLSRNESVLPPPPGQGPASFSSRAVRGSDRG